jgi:hypothetical protein
VRFADVVQDEEVGNAVHRDLGKIQMFGVTLFVFAYIGMSMLQISEPKANAAIDERPLNPGIVALLYISYAGSLTNKAGPNYSPPGRGLAAVAVK